MPAILLGAVLPILLAVAVVALRIEHIPSLLLAFAAFFGAAAYAARRETQQPMPLIAALCVPTVVLFAMFAWNAESWLLLTVPAAALIASSAGVMLGRRLKSQG